MTTEQNQTETNVDALDLYMRGFRPVGDSSYVSEYADIDWQMEQAASEQAEHREYLWETYIDGMDPNYDGTGRF